MLMESYASQVWNVGCCAILRCFQAEQFMGGV